MYDDAFGVGWWVLMMVGMAIFWIAIAFLVVWLFRADGRSPLRRESPEEILDRRLAGGDLSTEEYRERKEVLSGR